MASLIFGEIKGIAGFAWAAQCLGFPLSIGMAMRHLWLVSTVAGFEPAVAWFISTQACIHADLRAAAKMGALFSALVAEPALMLSSLLRAQDLESEEDTKSTTWTKLQAIRVLDHAAR